MSPAHFDPIRISKEMKRRIIQIRYRNEDECSICMRSMFDQTVAVTACGHAFHLKCEKQLRNSVCPTRTECPMCRQKLYANEDDSLVHFMESLPENDMWWLELSSYDIDAIIRSITLD